MYYGEQSSNTPLPFSVSLDHCFKDFLIPPGEIFKHCGWRLPCEAWISWGVCGSLFAGLLCDCYQTRSVNFRRCHVTVPLDNQLSAVVCSLISDIFSLMVFNRTPWMLLNVVKRFRNHWHWPMIVVLTGAQPPLVFLNRSKWLDKAPTSCLLKAHGHSRSNKPLHLDVFGTFSAGYQVVIE